MGKTKNIAILLTDSLRAAGLKHLFLDFFSPVEPVLFNAFKDFAEREPDSYDYFITEPIFFITNADFFLLKRNKTILLVQNIKEIAFPHSLNIVCTTSPKETIIEQLYKYLEETNVQRPNGEQNKGLSIRETDVLRLVVKGFMNKEIADRLHISLNTVLSHRKNIISKLGIKTLPGLTFYAIMNGVVAGDEIGF